MSRAKPKTNEDETANVDWDQMAEERLGQTPRRSDELVWTQFGSELRAVDAQGRQLRIKRDSNKLSGYTFFYCYGGHRYLGVEYEEAAAKARAQCGIFRVPGAELEAWLRDHHTTLPPALLASERERLRRWKAEAKARAAMPSEPNPAAHREVTKRGAPRAGRQGRAGKVSPAATFRFVKPENPYGAGTDRAAQAAIALAHDGKTVAQAVAAGAAPWVFRILLNAGKITLEDAG